MARSSDEIKADAARLNPEAARVQLFNDIAEFAVSVAPAFLTPLLLTIDGTGVLASFATNIFNGLKFDETFAEADQLSDNFRINLGATLGLNEDGSVNAEQTGFFQDSLNLFKNAEGRIQTDEIKNFDGTISGLKKLAKINNSNLANIKIDTQNFNRQIESVGQGQINRALDSRDRSSAASSAIESRSADQSREIVGQSREDLIRNLERLEGQGEVERLDIQDRFARRSGEIAQNQLERGLSGTTIGASLQSGNRALESRALGDLNERVNRQLTDVDTLLSARTLNALVGERDTANALGQQSIQNAAFQDERLDLASQNFQNILRDSRNTERSAEENRASAFFQNRANILGVEEGFNTREIEARRAALRERQRLLEEPGERRIKFLADDVNIQFPFPPSPVQAGRI